MRNVKLTIEYDGTNYNGWQVQRPGFKTIQGEIEKAIRTITGKKTTLYGSGRTDSGVHGKGQIANFHTNGSMPFSKLKPALNTVLPKDISIIKVKKVNKNFHSRYNAKSKIYSYTILNRKTNSPFLRKHTLHIPYKLNLSLIRKEAKVLLGRHNFKSFCASGNKHKSTIRTIKKITIIKNKNSAVIINIEANGFLYNMVRNIVGTLIEIGRGKFTPGTMKQLLKAKDRTKAGPTAPAHGLCLMKVRY